MSYKEYWVNKDFYWLVKYIFEDISSYAEGYILNYKQKYIGLIKDSKACNVIRFKILDSQKCVKLYINIPESDNIDSELRKSGLEYGYYEPLPSSYYVNISSREEYDQNSVLLAKLIISSINLRNKREGINEVIKEMPTRKPASFSSNLVIEYAGGQYDIADIVAKAKVAVLKNGMKNVKELNTYFQLETGMIFFTADGLEGSTSIYSDDNSLLEHRITNEANVTYVDIELNRIIKALNLPEDIELKKIESTKRIHLMYEEKGFAYIDYNKRVYHIFTRESILDTLGIEYISDENHGLNKAGIKNISFDDTFVLFEIVDLVKSGFAYDEDRQYKEQEDQEELVQTLNREQLYVIAKSRSSRNKKSTKRVVNSYERDVYIRDYSLARANGICQLCGNDAPFKKKNGQPYLESHHIEWLKDGGEDTIENTVALCPNCHRKMHVLNEEEDVKWLKKQALKECLLEV